MKVLYFSRGYSVHDHRFLSAIASSGHQTFFLRLEIADDQQVLNELPNDVEEIVWEENGKSFSWWRAPRMIASLRKLLADLQPDLLHAGPLSSVSVLAAASGFHPLVQMSWGSDILWEAQQSWKNHRLVRFSLKRADALIGDCQAVAARARQMGLGEEKIVLFPWGVNLKTFLPKTEKSPLREKLGWQDKFVILHLRNWEKIYGVQTVAKAFAQAAKDDPDLRLLMPGTGSLEDKVRAIFSADGILDRVHFAGQIAQTDLPNYYQAADMYLSASLSDGSSVSLMEALASGLPVLVSDIPGNREWVEEGEQGWFFPASNVNALAAAINRAREQQANFGRMGKSSRKQAEARADWSRNQHGISRAYDLATGQIRARA
jgi:glycosyltransferase involved in cell wall biosynthesis